MNPDGIINPITNSTNGDPLSFLFAALMVCLAGTFFISVVIDINWKNVFNPGGILHE